jgi:radical SAM superfamily enzyme YgiQ (UPF0313 family)
MTPPRILLIEPPFYRLHKDDYGLCRYPLGLGSLAAVITESALAEVRVVNCDFHPDPAPFSADYLTGEGYRSYRRNLTDTGHPACADLKRLVESFRPDLVGISIKTPVLSPALACARVAKAAAPEAVVIVGGPHPSVTGADLLIHKEVDIVVSGEGEAVLPELIRGLSSGKSLKETGTLEEIRGISFRRDGAVLTTPPRPALTDLDALPFVHRHAPAVLEEYHRYPESAFGHVFSARGCPFRCAFCSSRGVWGDSVRFRSEENILLDLAGLRGMGLDHVHFDDDTFGVTRNRLADLCRTLEQARTGLTYSCETHVSLITEATVNALARAGFTTVQLGLESGDDAMLRRIGKGFTVMKAREAARRVKAAGLRLEVFFMVGFPDETEDSLHATRRLMEILECDKLIYSIFTPYPGTPLFDRCRHLGLISDGYDYSRHSHQSPENGFCPNIGKDRFRSMASEIESLVAARNRAAGAVIPGR